MGMFSWKTQDTDRSISNKYSSKPTFRVVMYDNKGNKWVEDHYEGYGVFGGKDYYSLLAEMNGEYRDDDDCARAKGISIAYGDKPFLAPNLTESEDWVWKDEEPENCEYQGYFYDDDEDDYDDYEEESWSRDD